MSDIDDLIKSYLGESPFRACLRALRDIGITDPDELCEALISCAAHGVGERAGAWDDMNEVTKGKEAFETACLETIEDRNISDFEVIGDVFGEYNVGRKHGRKR